jgi:putative transposase
MTVYNLLPHPADGRDETVIRDYIRNQEQEDKRLDQMNLWR